MTFQMFGREIGNVEGATAVGGELVGGGAADAQGRVAACDYGDFAGEAGTGAWGRDGGDAGDGFEGARVGAGDG